MEGRKRQDGKKLKSEGVRMEERREVWRRRER